jgi:hypothetical protein
VPSILSESKPVSYGCLCDLSLTCPPKTDPHVKLERWIEGRQGNEQ